MSAPKSRSPIQLISWMAPPPHVLRPGSVDPRLARLVSHIAMNSFERAIPSAGASLRAPWLQVISHGHGADGRFFCCTHCPSQEGVEGRCRQSRCASSSGLTPPHLVGLSASRRAALERRLVRTARAERCAPGGRGSYACSAMPMASKGQGLRDRLGRPQSHPHRRRGCRFEAAVQAGNPRTFWRTSRSVTCITSEHLRSPESTEQN